MDTDLNKMKLVIDTLKAHLFITVISAFCVAALAVILIATIGMQEFIVPVCLLVMIEAAMAMFMKKSELWLHAVVVIVQIVVGFIIGRAPLTIMCAIIYVAATAALILLNNQKNIVQKDKERPAFKSKSKNIE